jgi:hypothetical protein
MITKKAPTAPAKRDRYGHTLSEIRREVDAAVESTKGTRGPLFHIYRNNLVQRGRSPMHDAGSTQERPSRRTTSGEYTDKKPRS